MRNVVIPPRCISLCSRVVVSMTCMSVSIKNFENQNLAVRHNGYYMEYGECKYNYY